MKSHAEMYGGNADNADSEWKSVVHARVEGASCPACTDRAVLTGYNDLATTDPQLLDQWDYLRNSGYNPKKFPEVQCRACGGNAHADTAIRQRCPKGR